MPKGMPNRVRDEKYSVGRHLQAKVSTPKKVQSLMITLLNLRVVTVSTKKKKSMQKHIRVKENVAQYTALPTWAVK